MGSTLDYWYHPLKSLYNASMGVTHLIIMWWQYLTYLFCREFNARSNAPTFDNWTLILTEPRGQYPRLLIPPTQIVVQCSMGVTFLIMKWWKYLKYVICVEFNARSNGPAFDIWTWILTEKPIDDWYPYRTCTMVWWMWWWLSFCVERCLRYSTF